MTKEQNNMEEVKPVKKSSIDFGALWRSVTKRKKTYYKVLGITFVLACIYALSLPRVYKCEVLLAPELSTSRNTSSLASLARSFGMRLGNNLMGGGSEALLPTLYPDLMNSVDFKTSLFDVKVCAKDSVKPKSYYDYLLNDQKRSWWGEAISGTIGALVDLIASEDTTDNSKVNPFMLTKQQTRIAQIIDRKVVCDVDQKTLVITIDVKDQDPVICATVADSVKERLQQFITDYRTNKARVDYEYNKKLCAEAKVRYEKARQRYAEFADANQDLVLQSVRTKLTDLENELQLQFTAYQTYVAQLQSAEAQVQQDTPAFMTLQSATVPVKPSAPSRKKIVFIFLFLAFAITTVRAFHKDGLLKPLLGLS